MQINQSRKKFGFIMLPILTLVLMNLVSCNEEDKSALNCLVLEKSDIESKWVTPGHTDPSRPASDLISYLTFTPVPNAAMDEITVSVQAYNSSYQAVGSKIDLNGARPCPVSLTGVTWGTNSIELNALSILDGGGSIKTDLDKIILNPAIHTEDGINYVKFEATIDYSTGTDSRIPILPCPPCIYCVPRCPDKDSTIMSTSDTMNLTDTIKPGDTLKKN